MVNLDDLAVAARDGDTLRLRSLTQDWLRENTDISRCPPPGTVDDTLRAISAGLVELLAERRREPPPSWTERVTAARRPVYLVKSAATLRRMRQLCETESPLPLRRRNVFAPPTFLEFA